MDYERDVQTIGRYVVSLRGEEADVWMVDQQQQIARNMTASEALIFLNWLQSHKDELYRAAQEEQQHNS